MRYTFIVKVTISKKAQKQIRKLPKNIVEALFVWVQTVEIDGLEAVKKIKGYRDEALKGDRKGQRSSRLNISYRVIYNDSNEIVDILEVNKHDY
jgi:proteic killer suppression protein